MDRVDRRTLKRQSISPARYKFNSCDASNDYYNKPSLKEPATDGQLGLIDELYEFDPPEGLVERVSDMTAGEAARFIDELKTKRPRWRVGQKKSISDRQRKYALDLCSSKDLDLGHFLLEVTGKADLEQLTTKEANKLIRHLYKLTAETATLQPNQGSILP